MSAVTSCQWAGERSAGLRRGRPRRSHEQGYSVENSGNAYVGRYIFSCCFKWLWLPASVLAFRTACDAAFAALLGSALSNPPAAKPPFPVPRRCTATIDLAAGLLRLRPMLSCALQPEKMRLFADGVLLRAGPSTQKHLKFLCTSRHAKAWRGGIVAVNEPKTAFFGE